MKYKSYLMLGLGACLAFSGACKKNKPKPTQASEQEGLTNRSLLRAGVLNPSTDAYNAEFNKSVLKTLSVFKWKGVSGSYNNNGKAGLFGTFSLLMPDISGNDGNNITFINPNLSPFLTLHRLTNESTDKLDFFTKTGLALKDYIKPNNPNGITNAIIANVMKIVDAKNYGVITSKFGIFFYEYNNTIDAKTNLFTFFSVNPLPYNIVERISSISAQDNATELFKVQYLGAGYQDPEGQVYDIHDAESEKKYTIFDARAGKLLVTETPEYTDLQHINGSGVFVAKKEKGNTFIGLTQVYQDIDNLYYTRMLLNEKFKTIEKIEGTELLKLFLDGAGFFLYKFTDPIPHRVIYQLETNTGGDNNFNGTANSSYTGLNGYKDLIFYSYATYDAKRIVGIRKTYAIGEKDKKWNTSADKNEVFHVFDLAGNRK
jgi:hypothetical protein